MCRSRDRGLDRRTTGVPIGYRQPEADDVAGDYIECTGGSCRSCTAVLIADCIAIGCCPCAVVNMLALALVKLPWRASRKCLRLQQGRRRSLGTRVGVGDDGGSSSTTISTEKVGKIAIEAKGLESIMAATTATGEGECISTSSSSGRRSLCSRMEADQKVYWMELYQRGHWGFGRVSFSGNLKEGHLAGKRSPSVSSPKGTAAVVGADDDDVVPIIKED